MMQGRVAGPEGPAYIWLSIAAALMLSLAMAQQASFNVVEASIADIHAAMREGRLTCRQLVDAYLGRIEAYDKQGPALNAIVVVNPNVRAEADAMDARYRQSGPAGPLHCVPMIVKDNFDTIGLQTAAGSLSLAGFEPDRDAFQVRRIKEAGALVLAKSNMAEFAFSPYETVNSILPGYTRNPYRLDRVTAGSSGGTAAAVAASFGAVGLGTDTGNSIRGPSSHQALVGIRSTMGLTSRAGVVPLNLRADIAGPMARTVVDAVTVFQVIAGEDPNDPATARSRGRQIPNYADSLDAGGLRGARIGVLRQAWSRGNREDIDDEVRAVFLQALDDLRAAGAEIVDPADVDFDGVQRARGAGSCMGFKYDINQYLASHGDRIPMKTLEEIVESNRYHPSIQSRLRGALDGDPQGPDSEACQADDAYRAAYGEAITKTMDALRLDAYVYPTWSYPPRLIGDLNTPHGDNSQVFSPRSGFPAVQVPMGYTRDNTLPAGLTIFGRAWDEARLIRLAFAYEQATRHRRPPATTPVLR